MNKYKKYLPSKKFIFNILIILALIAIYFGVKGAISLFKNKTGGKYKGEPIKMTIGSINEKDGNKNGIADWEEYLWGLDPYKNGPENKDFILAKKKSLEQKGIITSSDDTISITENEILSKQFFATIMSLQQTGQLDEESIKSVSESIGQQIVPIPLESAYTQNMLNIKADSSKTHMDYIVSLTAILKKYKNDDLGSELLLLSQGVANNDPQALYSAKTVALAYRAFSEELVKVPVPSSYALAHLNLSNDYEKIAQSIEGLTQIITDPIVGMRSLLNYKKYTDAIGTDLNDIASKSN
ncbi:MAG: hypothetical protein NTU81_01985 [Candidatus Nomurabacteria bacterium]|nr:hypothetical protein [Candidatus Nomurabacteria bacterium]